MRIYRLHIGLSDGGGHDWGGAKDLDSTKTSMAFLKKLTDCMNWKEFELENYKPTYFDLNIVSMHFYHNMCFIFKGNNS